MSEPLDEGQEPGTAASSQAPEPQPPVEENDDRLLRLAADFENYKKRAARERREYVQLANERLIVASGKTPTSSPAARARAALR